MACGKSWGLPSHPPLTRPRMSSGEGAAHNLEEVRRQNLPRPNPPRGLNPEGEGREKGVGGERKRPGAYHEHGDPGGQRVEEHGGHGAAVLRARVGLAVGAVVAEEALYVHGERVRILEVVRQHHRPCHDHHLEIEHAAGERRGQQGHARLPGRAEPSRAERAADAVGPLPGPPRQPPGARRRGRRED